MLEGRRCSQAQLDTWKHEIETCNERQKLERKHRTTRLKRKLAECRSNDDSDGSTEPACKRPRNITVYRQLVKRSQMQSKKKHCRNSNNGDDDENNNDSDSDDNDDNDNNNTNNDNNTNNNNNNNNDKGREKDLNLLSDDTLRKIEIIRHNQRKSHKEMCREMSRESFVAFRKQMPHALAAPSKSWFVRCIDKFDAMVDDMLKNPASAKSTAEPKTILEQFEQALSLLRPMKPNLYEKLFAVLFKFAQFLKQHPHHITWKHSRMQLLFDSAYRKQQAMRQSFSSISIFDFSPFQPPILPPVFVFANTDSNSINCVEKDPYDGQSDDTYTKSITTTTTTTANNNNSNNCLDNRRYVRNNYYYPKSRLPYSKIPTLLNFNDLPLDIQLLRMRKEPRRVDLSKLIKKVVAINDSEALAILSKYIEFHDPHQCLHKQNATNIDLNLCSSSSSNSNSSSNSQSQHQQQQQQQEDATAIVVDANVERKEDTLNNSK
ncbi:hypothetical protein RFI_12527, partial [Reticulomyxa filosa]